MQYSNFWFLIKTVLFFILHSRDSVKILEYLYWYGDIAYTTLDSFLCRWPIFIQSNSVSSRMIQLHSCIVDFCRGYIIILSMCKFVCTNHWADIWKILENNTQVPWYITSSLTKRFENMCHFEKRVFCGVKLGLQGQIFFGVLYGDCTQECAKKII